MAYSECGRMSVVSMGTRRSDVRVNNDLQIKKTAERAYLNTVDGCAMASNDETAFTLIQRNVQAKSSIPCDLQILLKIISSRQQYYLQRNTVSFHTAPAFPSSLLPRNGSHG